MFAALKDDARLGDLARYKVFICDLFGGHEAIAARDLALLDQTGDKPSYYFGRAVWCGTHDQPAAATRYISQATGRFSTTICDLYAAAYAHARLFNPALASFTTKDGREFKHARVALEQDGLRVSTNSGWVTIPLDQLPDDLSTFSDDLRDQIDLQRHSAVSTGAGTVPVSFTTRHGRTYDSAQAWLGDDGVDLMTATGPVSVPFADLPADLSPFPADWRTAIQAQRKSNASHTTPETTVSFTTKTGTVYNTVSATLGSDGVMILTPEGLTTVPFTDLPADLSAFPASWRPLIQDWLKSSLGDTSGVQVVSFTTRRGKHYDQVRAALDDKGLDVLGPDGWVEVSFDEVPADLSPFPAAWREAIATGQKAPANAPNN